MKLVFNDGKYLDNVKVNRDYSIDGNIATITGDTPNTSGFYFEEFGVRLGVEDYGLYTTLYRQLEGKYQLSNDGSIYIPPAPPEPPVPHEFTHTPILLNGEEYDALDLSGLSFYLVDGEYDFSDVYEITIDGVSYSDFAFEGTSKVEIDEETYVSVSFRELSELEVQVAQNTANIDYISMETGIEL